METNQQQLETPEAAQAAIAAHRADQAWIKGYLDGDQAKHAEMTRLHSIAYPQPAAEGKPAPAADKSPDTFGIPEAATGPMAEPPRGIWDYPDFFGADASNA